MRRTLFSPYSNPIARREISAYEHGVPTWMRRCDTVGIVAVSLATCVYLIVRWLHNLQGVWTSSWIDISSPDLMAYLQITIFIIYGCVLVRCLIAGISVAHRYQKQRYRNAIILTNLTNRQILFGQWYAALYQVRGWMVALGLVRIAIIVINAAQNQFIIYSNGFDFAYHPAQLPVAFSFIIVLGLLEVWATTGVGILAATWVRPVWFAGIIAIVLRILPILIFTWFPVISMSYPIPIDWLVLRWQEYTWFAFVDGGTTAVLRLTLFTLRAYPNSFSGEIFARSTLAFLAASHMLLVYGIGVYILAHLKWRWAGALYGMENRRLLFLSKISVSRRRLENLLTICIALAICIAMCIVWRDGKHIISYPKSYTQVDYYLTFLHRMQVILAIAIATTTLRSIYAGVVAGSSLVWHRSQTAQSDRTLYDFMRLSLNLCGQLRGWFFGLSAIFMTGFALLILERWFNISAIISITQCDRNANIYCRFSSQSWLLSQWVFAMVFSIVVSGLVSLSSISIGVASANIFRHRLTAFCVSLVVRVIPVFFALLSSYVPPSDNDYQSLVYRWHYQPWRIFADTGISALLGFAEPDRGFGYTDSLTYIGFGLLAFTLVIYMLLGYIALSLIAVKVKYRRTHTITAKLVSDVHR